MTALRDASVLPDKALWLSSPEPKARGTAALLTSGDVSLDDELREAGRPAAYLDKATFERQVLDSFADPARPVAPGWEPLAETLTRVVRAARAAVAEAGGADVVLVGHGTSLTMLVAALTGGPPDVMAWQRMRLPDHCCVTWPDTLAAPWGHWVRPA